MAAAAAPDADPTGEEPALLVVSHPAVEAGVVVREHVVAVTLVRESIRAWDTGAVLLEGTRDTTKKKGDPIAPQAVRTGKRRAKGSDA